jgi:hypothetical protein
VDDDWVTREDVALATVPVKSYTRMEHGRPQQVHAYQRMWWIPHPDWEKGQQRWITAGEAAWHEHGEAARAKDKAADAAADKAGGADRDAGTAVAMKSGKGAAAGVAPQLGTEGREPHNYLEPDPARLENANARVHKTPGDHPFFKRNPMTPENIVKAYDGTTPSEKNQGLRWYADAHRLAWALGGGDAELGAKMLSAYSPRTGWPLNMFSAARSLAENRALGPGEGVILGAAQKTGQKILDGADIDTAFPSPKTNAFARLIALGEDHPEDPLGQVVIDRHALSVAAGRRLTKEDVEGKGENASPIGKPQFYEHVADQYRSAARMISDRDGEEISPHQLQAITWLRQQRVNTADDLINARGSTKGLVTAMRNHWTAWQSWAKEHGIDTQLGTTAQAPVPVTAAEARGNSRGVSAAEFNDVASRGRDLLNSMEADRSPVTGLVSNWGSLKESAWSEVTKPGGGMTIDAHSGEALASDADKYALSVKPPGVGSVSVPENATEQQFAAAMDEALVKFRSLLEQSGHYLGVFHDDDSHRIDIDPVAVVDSADDAEAMSAYTHNIGGAYHFASGNGYFPPHITGELRGVVPRLDADGQRPAGNFRRRDFGWLGGGLAAAVGE